MRDEPRAAREEENRLVNHFESGRNIYASLRVQQGNEDVCGHTFIKGSLRSSPWLLQL